MNYNETENRVKSQHLKLFQFQCYDTSLKKRNKISLTCKKYVNFLPKDEERLGE